MTNAQPSLNQSGVDMNSWIILFMLNRRFLITLLPSHVPDFSLDVALIPLHIAY